MSLQLIIEAIVLCAIFVLLIFLVVAKDRKNGLHWYPKHVQEIAIERWLTTKEEIEKRRKQTKLVGMLLYLVVVCGSVYIVNGVRDFSTAWFQMSFILMVVNIFDAFFVDYVWVQKTDYWIIEELKDVKNIGKPLGQILKERIISSVVLVLSAGIIAFLVSKVG